MPKNQRRENHHDQLLRLSGSISGSIIRVAQEKESLSRLFQPCFPPPLRKGLSMRRSMPEDGVIDRKVLAMPDQGQHTVESLGTYLMKLAPSPREKVRAVFRWITHNIAYDTKSLLTKRYGDQTPAGVLQRRTAVCAGYAQLVRVRLAFFQHQLGLEGHQESTIRTKKEVTITVKSPVIGDSDSPSRGTQNTGPKSCQARREECYSG